VVNGEDYGSSKPDPEGYAIALKRLGVKADEAVINRGFARTGLSAAKKLGCTAFGLKTYMPDEQLKGADRIFGTADEISEFFGKN
jgi:beta-phosphoglucomutase-like phosphatase (HAD superfamily)